MSEGHLEFLERHVVCFDLLALQRNSVAEMGNVRGAAHTVATHGGHPSTQGARTLLIIMRRGRGGDVLLGTLCVEPRGAECAPRVEPWGLVQ